MVMGGWRTDSEEGGEVGRKEGERENTQEKREARKKERKRPWVLLLSVHLTSCMYIFDLSGASIFSSVKWE